MLNIATSTADANVSHPSLSTICIQQEFSINQYKNHQNTVKVKTNVIL